MVVERRKKGFAIILVAALAGFVFLLGASLVAVTRLQSASANYDQRVRLAREHARAALEMAIGDLQQFASNDRQVTYNSDVYRSNVGANFNEAEPEGLREPFWMGASDDSNERWLVTKALDGTSFSPVGEANYETVNLLGNGSVGSDFLEVDVPMESIQVSGVHGYAENEQKTIGHYAYWVGDLGVKASYALYDQSGEMTEGSYGMDTTLIDGTDLNDRQLRLTQLRLGKPYIDFVDTNRGEGEETLADSNPLRIDRVTNDFQFRERYGTSANDERYLLGLTENELEGNFQDFTPLSKGLLVNASSVSNEYRRSVDYVTDLEGEVWDDNLREYQEYYDAEYSSVLDYDKGTHVFQITSVDDAPSIAPVMTQFNLNASLYIVVTDEDASPKLGDLYISYNASCSLWNPFSTYLEAETLSMNVSGLPHLTVWFDSTGNASIWDGDLDELLSPEFQFGEEVNDGGANTWRPGQIAVFSGPELDEEESAEGVTELEFGIEHVSGSDKRVFQKLNSEAIELPDGEFSLVYSFINDDVPDPADLSIEVLGSNDGEAELLAVYQLDGASGRFIALEKENPSPLDQGIPTFGFSWKIGETEYPFGTGYWPFEPSIPVDALSPFDPSADHSSNVSPSYESATLSIFGYNPSDVSESEEAISIEPEFDFPVFELPKQEITSIVQLRNVWGAQFEQLRLGEPHETSSPNGLFDEFFVSSIASDWADGETIANAQYVPLAGTLNEDLVDEDSAEHFEVHGAFNVHSTSIDAWETLLKACSTEQLGSRALQYESLEDDGEDANTEWDEPHFLFFNLPQNAADVFIGDFDSATIDTNLEKYRMSNRASVFALNELEVRLLATYIVSNIRKRISGISFYGSNSGPFLSLQDFIDSGVVSNAISDFENDSLGGKQLTPDWADIDGTENAKFTQATVLNAIAPFLVVRSDTFLVRVYGDAVDPSDSTKIWARAYCEAIVQRVRGVASEGSDYRKMELIAFRWLSPLEI